MSELFHAGTGNRAYLGRHIPAYLALSLVLHVSWYIVYGPRLSKANNEVQSQPQSLHLRLKTTRDRATPGTLPTEQPVRFANKASRTGTPKTEPTEAAVASQQPPGNSVPGATKTIEARTKEAPGVQYVQPPTRPSTLFKQQVLSTWRERLAKERLNRWSKGVSEKCTVRQRKTEIRICQPEETVFRQTPNPVTQTAALERAFEQLATSDEFKQDMARVDTLVAMQDAITAEGKLGSTSPEIFREDYLRAADEMAAITAKYQSMNLGKLLAEGFKLSKKLLRGE